MSRSLRRGIMSVPSGPQPIVATGGTITDINDDGIDYRVHTFTSSGTFEVISGSGNIETVLVAAGGASGGSYNGYAGGGGGGGVISDGPNGILVSVEVGTYPIVIGVGASLSNGGDTTGFSQTAIGGGRGADQNFGGGSSGGSGGGTARSNSGGWAGTPGQGYAGSHGWSGSGPDSSGAGGGAGGPATNGQNGTGGNGGPGRLIQIRGYDEYFGGGGSGQYLGAVGGIGGGATHSTSSNVSNGAPNTGGGAAGGVGTGYSVGGSGICIIRYPI